MMKATLWVLTLSMLAPLCLSQDKGDSQLIYQSNWRAFPFEKKSFLQTPASLKQNWQHLHRATHYPFPDARFIAQLLAKNPKLKASIPQYQSINQVASTLQLAWIAFFEGNFQKATQLGYSLGPIGHCVAFYAQATYASRLETNDDKRHALWEDVLNRHQLSSSLTRYDSMTRFFAFFSMARLSEELSMPVVVARDYLNKMLLTLAELNADEPNNIFVLAARGSIDAGIVRKLGKLMGRLAFGANDESIEKYYFKALTQDKNLPTVHIEYAQALLYMYGKKKLDQAIQHMKIASEAEPGYALEAMNTFKAQKRLEELLLIKKNKGYGLRRYVKRNRAAEKNYYF
ncbi:MAG: hypothetical protein V7785_16710 [Bermanella sp.]